MTQNDKSNSPRGSSGSAFSRLFMKLLRGVQWAVCVFVALLVVFELSELRKVDAPGAPAAWIYAAIGIGILVAIAHAPYVFWRLPGLAQWGAHVATFGVLTLCVVETVVMKPVWERTPAGAKEAADYAAREHQVAVAAERREAAEKQEKDAEAEQAAAQQAAGRAAQKIDLCNTLTKQVVDGEKVLELNNVAVETSVEPNETLTCSGDAITSHGNMRIEFGLVSTPQGKALLSIRYP